MKKYIQKIWKASPEPNPDKVRSLAEELRVDRVTARLLIKRGIGTFEQAEQFFRSDLTRLHDPMLMQDMDKAVTRLSQAIENGEKILVYGDYDVDGTTAVSMMYSFLTGLGTNCEYYIPDRYTEGYGFSEGGARYAAESGCGLIITLDCGIKDKPSIMLASSLGVDVIVCDHHNVASVPPACAVLNPKRPDCNYPDKNLSGCGVGFKLIQAVSDQLGIEEERVWSLLDFVAISIGADIVPMVGENRILATYGLDKLNTLPRRPGFQAMLDNAAFKRKELSIEDVVFILAPRINAAGRISSGRLAIELMLAETTEDAIASSKVVEANNQTRRGHDKDITEDALGLLSLNELHSDAFTTVVQSENWHKGVVGIVASRLVENFYKPAIVLVNSDGKLTGSARSIPGVDLFEALTSCEDLLLKYGGHAMAAGLTLEENKLGDFTERFEDVVAAMLGHERPVPVLEYEGEISFGELNAQFFRRLKHFAPFGPDNMKPVFLARKVVNAGFTKRVGSGQEHLKLHLSQPHQSTITMDGIGFWMGDWEASFREGREHDILFTLEENEWNNRVSIQLGVKDIRLSQ
ncbi:MAG: single-stranded-DNA-specific exonuclease RecJ [Bacteroidota bacterium]